MSDEDIKTMLHWYVYPSIPAAGIFLLIVLGCH